MKKIVALLLAFVLLAFTLLCALPSLAETVTPDSEDEQAAMLALLEEAYPDTDSLVFTRLYNADADAYFVVSTDSNVMVTALSSLSDEDALAGWNTLKATFDAYNATALRLLEERGCTATIYFVLATFSEDSQMIPYYSTQNGELLIDYISTLAEE